MTSLVSRTLLFAFVAFRYISPLYPDIMYSYQAAEYLCQSRVGMICSPLWGNWLRKDCSQHTQMRQIR